MITYCRLGFLITALALSVGCARPQTELRPETLQVWHSSTKEDLNVVQISPSGEAEGRIHIISSEELDIKYTNDGSEWFRISEIEEPVRGHYIVNFDADPVDNSMSERTGILGITCSEKYFGRFVTIRQGYKEIFRDDFDKTREGFLALEPGQSYTTGFIDAGINKTFYDYVCFNAYVQCGAGVQKLSFTLDLEILGGAVEDDTWSEDAAFEIDRGSSFDSRTFKYVLISNKGEKISGDTRFRFSFSEDTGSDVRLLIDNLTVCSVDAEETTDNPDDIEDDEDNK